jgi:hypothetical protein
MRGDNVQLGSIAWSSRHKSLLLLPIIASGHNVRQGTLAWPFCYDVHTFSVSISAQVPVVFSADSQMTRYDES